MTAAVTADPAPTWVSRWLGGVAIFLVVMTPLLAYLAPLGFAPLMALTGLLALPGLRRTRAAAPPLLVLVALALWAMVSMTWSPAAIDPTTIKDYGDVESLTAMKLVLQLATYGAAVVVLRGLSEATSLRSGTILAYGMTALAVVAAVDALMGARIYQALHLATGEPIRPDLAMVKVSMATYALALLLWPVSLILSRRRASRAILLLVVGMVTTSLIVSSDACLAALVLGAGAWLLVRYAGRNGAKILVGLVAAPFVLAPLAVLLGVQTGVVAWLHEVTPASWDARLNIWTFAADHIQTHPFRGWGLDASRTFGTAIPLHTHNAQLQLWLELGAIGAALAGVFFCWLAYGVVRLCERSRGEAAMAAGALVSYLVIGGLSFGVWQEWWLGLGAVTLIACGLARFAAPSDRVDLVELTPLG
jgi:O-antigen ligase